MLILDLLNYAWRMGFMPFIGVGGSQNYEIKKSLRFRASASAWLTRTFSGYNNTYTVSFWVKRGTLGTLQVVLASRDAGVGGSNLSFTATDTLSLALGGTAVGATTAVFRDPAAWYHIVLRVTAGGTAKIDVNGVEVLSAAAGAAPYLWRNGSAFVNAIGRNGDSATSYFDGYISEMHYVDNLNVASSSFGQTDPASGAWVPKKYTGTYGTHGFYLGFTDGASLTTLGNDESGNNNDWTLNNVSITSGITYDWMDDTPTNNFATLNPVYFAGTQSNASLTHASASTSTNSRSTVAMRSGKWYWEGTAGSANVAYGIGDSNLLQTEYPLTTADAWMYAGVNGNKYNGSAVAYGATFTTSDIIGVAFDADAGAIEFFKNGVSQGVAFTGLVANDYFAVVSGTTAGAITAHINFGQRPFAYTPPTGFKALCAQNLPTLSVKRGANYFDVNLRTGTGAVYSVTGKRFSPALVWIKARSTNRDNVVYDAARGATKQIITNSTAAESTEATALTSFNADGFSGGSQLNSNANGVTFVDWLWREAAGFLDIVSFTKTGSAAENFNHSLGVTPAAIIMRDLAGASNTFVFHQALADMTDKYLLLNTTAVVGSLTTDVNAPTSSTFSASGSTVVAGNSGIAYLFAEVEGFSKMASYIGNGSADGPFVWCGFRPRWILFKRATVSTSNWWIYDTERNTYNAVDSALYPDLNNAEGTSGFPIDILSNGFKFRSATYNVSGSQYVFMAFAETPFKYANAR
jgi:hypothetical protein